MLLPAMGKLLKVSSAARVPWTVRRGAIFRGTGDIFRVRLLGNVRNVMLVCCCLAL